MTEAELTKDCPEPHCGLSFSTKTEVLSHLEWDHNRRKRAALRMTDHMEWSDDE